MNTQTGEQVLMYYGEAVPLTSKNRSLKQALLIQFSNHIPPWSLGDCTRLPASVHTEIKTDSPKLKFWAKQGEGTARCGAGTAPVQQMHVRLLNPLQAPKPSVPCSIQEHLWIYCHEVQWQHCHHKHRSLQQSCLPCYESSSGSLRMRS